MENAVKQEPEILQNSLSELAGSIAWSAYGGPFGRSQLSQVDTLSINNRWYLISNYRQLLSELYVEHGIVQTLVDQPVDDGFRAGFEVKSEQLDGDNIEQLMNFLERNRVIYSIMQALKWARLFGGGAILVITDQDPKTPLNIKAINEKTPLEFRSCDLWELYFSEQNTQNSPTPGGAMGDYTGQFYDYYGVPIHKSRVFRINGKEPPSFVRPRLRGWGMSEMEKVVRSLNQFLKNEDVIFNLIDEAKVDIYKIRGLNEALMNSAGTNLVSNRIQNANIIKNYLHALTMDANDDYIQKQISFSGLAEVMTQIRQGIASDLKMPMTKLFGISSAGFNSGEDDIENYNSMVEGEIRSKSKYIVADVIQICCQKLFGFTMDDLQITFNPMREMTAEEQEKIKNHKFNRTMSAYQSGLISSEEAKESINKDSLLPIEIDPSLEAMPPIDGNYLTSTGDNVDAP